LYAEHAKELRRLEGALQGLLANDLARVNEEAKKLQLPFVIVPGPAAAAAPAAAAK
jgi:hypothetical protein